VRRGGKAVRDREDAAAIVRILQAEAFLCWDCRTARYRVEHDGERFTVALYHLKECPALRSGWSARAADDYIRAVLILGGLHLADYLDVTGVHRTAPA
jgi:hypothetical protein